MNKEKQIIAQINALLLVSIFFFLGCNETIKNTAKQENVVVADTINHGYNELANTSKNRSFTTSDFNTDNTEIKNIDRPKKSTIKTNLDTTQLFGVWTSDPTGPHADFVLSSKSFYVVDYDGDGAMPYELFDRKIKIYYNDFIQEGKVISVNKDTLRISWEDIDQINFYVRWTY